MLAVFALVTTCMAAAPLDEGKARWSVMELEKAASLFEAAVQRARDDEERAHAYVWLGMARAELGDFPVAKNAFMSALRLRPDITLPDDAGEIPPRVRGLFEAAKLDVEGPRPLPRDPLPDEQAETKKDAHDDVIAPSAAAPAARVEEGSPLLVVGAVALVGSGVMLLGTAAVVDVASGPEAFDGGTISIACLGAGAVMLLAGGGLVIAAALSH